MKKSIVVSAIIIGAAIARADDSTAAKPASSGSTWSPIQLSLTPDIAVCKQTTVINGLSLNIWGDNRIHGLDLGIVNGSHEHSAGLTAGLVNYDESYTGLAVGVVNYSKERFAGMQYGIVNIAEGEFNGWQDGMVNVSKGTCVGLQSSYFNFAEKFTGLQVGIVNYAKELHGVQVGIANIAMNNGWFDQMPDKFAKGFPIVNWSF